MSKNRKYLLALVGMISFFSFAVYCLLIIDHYRAFGSFSFIGDDGGFSLLWATALAVIFWLIYKGKGGRLGPILAIISFLPAYVLVFLVLALTQITGDLNFLGMTVILLLTTIPLFVMSLSVKVIREMNQEKFNAPKL